MPRLLIVEDEDALRAGMVRALSKMTGVTVDAAATVGEAIELIDGHAPDAVISDLDLPDRLGTELLAELDARGLHVPVTFVSAYSRELGAKVPRAAHVRVVEKPLSIDQLREIAKAALSAKDSVLPPPFGAPDYLQIACLGRHSVVITMRARPSDATPLGRIVIWQGELWAARDAFGRGEDAFRRMVTGNGTFRCHTLEREPGPREIETPWEALLMDAMRMLDETRASAPSAIEPSPVFAADPYDYDAAIETAIEALLRRDHDTALGAFLAALAARPDDPLAHANVVRLRAMSARRHEDDPGGAT